MSHRPTVESARGAGSPILSVRDLTVKFKRGDGTSFSVVDHVSFEMHANEIVGIVGESGSGKSITARSILRLLPRGGEMSGGVEFQGDQVFDLPEAELRALRGGRIAMVFQDPMTSFNPVLRVGEQIGEALAVHGAGGGRRTLREKIVALLQRVGIHHARERADAYPHEFSGGMRQRALTAMALANGPALLIADEPTTALDVTVQDQILDLMRDLNQQADTAILMITHNIAVVASLCSRVIVMYAGRVVEDGPVDAVLGKPAHPYTWSLLKSVPRLEKSCERLTTIVGQPPDPANLPLGCKFAPRCPFAIPTCLDAEPTLDPLDPAHKVRCWLPDAVREQA